MKREPNSVYLPPASRFTKKKKKASEYHGLFLLFISGNIKPDFSFYILFRNVVLNSASPNQALAKVALKDHLSSWTCGNLLL